MKISQPSCQQGISGRSHSDATQNDVSSHDHQVEASGLRQQLKSLLKENRATPAPVSLHHQSLRSNQSSTSIRLTNAVVETEATQLGSDTITALLKEGRSVNLSDQIDLLNLEPLSDELNKCSLPLFVLAETVSISKKSAGKEGEGMDSGADEKVMTHLYQISTFSKLMLNNLKSQTQDGRYRDFLDMFNNLKADRVNLYLLVKDRLSTPPLVVEMDPQLSSHVPLDLLSKLILKLGNSATEMQQLYYVSALAMVHLCGVEDLFPTSFFKSMQPIKFTSAPDMQSRGIKMVRDIMASLKTDSVDIVMRNALAVFMKAYKAYLKKEGPIDQTFVDRYNQHVKNVFLSLSPAIKQALTKSPSVSLSQRVSDRNFSN